MTSAMDVSTEGFIFRWVTIQDFNSESKPLHFSCYKISSLICDQNHKKSLDMSIIAEKCEWLRNRSNIPRSKRLHEIRN